MNEDFLNFVVFYVNATLNSEELATKCLTLGANANKKPTVPSENVFLPLVHIKPGIMKNFVKVVQAFRSDFN